MVINDGAHIIWHLPPWQRRREEWVAAHDKPSFGTETTQSFGELYSSRPTCSHPLQSCLHVVLAHVTDEHRGVLREQGHFSVRAKPQKRVDKGEVAQELKAAIVQHKEHRCSR